MKRAILAIVASLYGLFALVTFHPEHSAVAVTGPVDADPFGDASPDVAESTTTTTAAVADITTTTAGTASSTTAPPAQVTPSTVKAPTTTTTRPATSTTTSGFRTVRGSVVSTEYGDVQVAIRLQDNQIVDVATVKYTSSDATSKIINDDAIPKLNREAIAAKSANIAVVSGATYTSNGYKESLQSAIDAI